MARTFDCSAQHVVGCIAMNEGRRPAHTPHNTSQRHQHTGQTPEAATTVPDTNCAYLAQGQIVVLVVWDQVCSTKFEAFNMKIEACRTKIEVGVCHVS